MEMRSESNLVNYFNNIFQLTCNCILRLITIAISKDQDKNSKLMRASPAPVLVWERRAHSLLLLCSHSCWPARESHRHECGLRPCHCMGSATGQRSAQPRRRSWFWSWCHRQDWGSSRRSLHLSCRAGRGCSASSGTWGGCRSQSWRSPPADDRHSPSGPSGDHTLACAVRLSAGKRTSILAWVVHLIHIQDFFFQVFILLDMISLTVPFSCIMACYSLDPRYLGHDLQQNEHTEKSE